MRWLRKVRGGLATAWELNTGLWNGPHWWLVPVLWILLPAAILLVFVHSVPMAAPFVYSIF